MTQPPLPPPDYHPPETLTTPPPSVHRQGPFSIQTRKLPILKADPITALTTRLGIPPPEMIFGDNLVSITHLPTSWTITFTAEDALALVDKTTAPLRVAYASSWSSSREKTSAEISEVVKPFDWSYTTDYKGTEQAGKGGETLGSDEGRELPMALLRRRDPILFHDEVVLYESELDDNGISLVTVKLRVMEERMLLLCRMFMRLDNVLVRVRDTRVYVDFRKEEVLREYVAREEGFEAVKRSLLRSGLPPDGVTIAMKDAQEVVEHVKIVERKMESVSLKAR